MNHRIRHCIVIGSSRGLGAALVDELITTGYTVIGVARTGIEHIMNHKVWLASEKYSHFELDIGSDTALVSLRSICSGLDNVPVCIIFNAACMETDVRTDNSIDFDVFRETNRVGVDGLGNVLQAFEDHLLTHGGILVGISSFSALAPSVAEPKISYAASKAYMDMTLRSLKLLWGERAGIVTVHLGHIGSHSSKPLAEWISPAYSKAAQKIVSSISFGRIPAEINYPLIYCIAYKYIFTLIPDIVHFGLVRFFTGLAGHIKGRSHKN